MRNGISGGVKVITELGCIVICCLFHWVSSASLSKRLAPELALKQQEELFEQEVITMFAPVDVEA